MNGLRTLTILTCLLILAGCRERASVAGSSASSGSSGYVPGLGEIMSLTQMRHAKLWLAGEARNWPLADYELDELEEGFQDAMEFHPTHKSSPIPLTQAIPSMIFKGPLDHLRAAIEKQDAPSFVRAFDALTAACNACHQASHFGFNVVTRPTGSTFSNQSFASTPTGK